MKKFILRVFAVLVPFVAVVGTIVRLAYVTELNVLKRSLTCPTNIVAAVVGDSRVEVYFDPAVMPWLRNFGLSATPFPVSAQKARLIAELNPHLKLLIVDIWPSKFFADLDKPFAVTERASPYACSLVELMTRHDMPPLGEGFEVRLANGVLKPGLRHLMFGADDAESGITGKFAENDKFLFEETPEGPKVRTAFGPPEKPTPLAKTPTGGEVVLEHLLEDLSSTGIKVVLTTTPILWSEKRWTPEARAYFERRMMEIARKFGVTWYNWMDEYQNATNLWADGCHLNTVGARVFSCDKKDLLEQLIW